MSHLSIYVYLLFLLLLWMGIKRCFPRTIRIERLLFIPVLMAVLGSRSFFGLFPSAGTTAFIAGVLGGALGLVVGYRHVQGWNIVVNRQARLVSLPGDVTMFVIILATFVFEFALNYGVLSGASWAASAVLPPVAAAIWCCFIGMSAGRNLNLTQRFIRSETQT
jgi:hypothetical protein